MCVCVHLCVCVCVCSFVCVCVCVIQDSFEPWFIGARDQTEWFDIRYRGYGKNKIEQVRCVHIHTHTNTHASSLHTSTFLAGILKSPKCCSSILCCLLTRALR